MEPIKRIADLTHEEILAIPIGSEKYQQIIDLECAHAGISLLPPDPGPKPETAGNKPDSTLYKLGSWGFLKIEDAEEILRLMASKGIWETSSNNGVQVIKRLHEDSYYWPEIKSVPAFSEAEFAKIKDVAAQQADALAIWNEKNREYQNALKEREAVVKEFTGKANYAREVTNGVTKILSNLRRYIVLAQGQYPIAIGFLKEADKRNEVSIEGDTVYYQCTEGRHHLVITREQYQQDSMNTLLGVA